MSYSLARVMGRSIHIHEDAERGVVSYLTLEEAAYDLCSLNDSDEDNAYCVIDNDTEQRVDPSKVLLACLNCGYEDKEKWGESGL